MEKELVDISDLNLSNEELFSHYDHSAIDSERITAPRYSYWKSVFRVFFRNKMNIVILALLGIVIAFSFIYPLFSNYDANLNVMDTTAQHLSPSAAIEKFGFNIKWILGTRGIGQSNFDAIWNGARISISLAFVCAAINMTIGVVIGAIWGFSKKVDIFMTEVYNIVGNVPYILVISVLVLVMKGTFWTLVFAMTVTGWIAIAYFIRTQVVIIRDREYNLASRCLGTSITRIAFRNILPFMTSVIVTLLATELPSYISYEVFLSYLGIGIKTDMTLGRMIEEANSYIGMSWQMEFWTPTAIAAIIAVVLYVVGQNLGDASDPRTHM